MPELPEVEAVVRACREQGLEGQFIERVRVLRALIIRPQSTRAFTRAVQGKQLLKVERRAKNIVLHLSGDTALRIHLRMTGDLRVEASTLTKFPPSFRLVWYLSGGGYLIFDDARALGRVHVYPESKLGAILATLGPEPLDAAFTPAVLAGLARRSRLPAKLFLMDQSKIAGLGNIYAAEALFRAKISPRRPINELSPARLRRLYTAIQQTLSSAVDSVYIAYRSPDGYRGHRDGAQRFVYGRDGEPCVTCGTAIRRLAQGGRSTYYCGRCQRQ